MLVGGEHYRTIWPIPERGSVGIIDQTRLPHRFETVEITDAVLAIDAISGMQVRGAPLIGATGAFALWLALQQDPSDHSLDDWASRICSARPTAVNLEWAVRRVSDSVRPVDPGFRAEAALAEAGKICEEDVEHCNLIGKHGLKLIEGMHEKKPDLPVNILTHCNAGWLATIDWGTATSPIYHAQREGIPVHVWVDETRPRNQGAALTCFELVEQGVPHTLVADNAGGHLMQQGKVDLVITGSDRTARNGDVANKIGTYLKALAARDNDVPFYVALPSSTIDWRMNHGSGIPIENRSDHEVTHVHGVDDDDNPVRVRISPTASKAVNPAFDVTPARLVSGLITERGISDASPRGLATQFPEMSL